MVEDAGFEMALLRVVTRRENEVVYEVTMIEEACQRTNKLIESEPAVVVDDSVKSTHVELSKVNNDILRVNEVSYDLQR